MDNEKSGGHKGEVKSKTECYQEKDREHRGYKRCKKSRRVRERAREREYGRDKDNKECDRIDREKTKRKRERERRETLKCTTERDMREKERVKETALICKIILIFYTTEMVHFVISA